MFEPYTEEVHEETFEWIAAHGIFPEDKMGSSEYERALFRWGEGRLRRLNEPSSRPREPAMTERFGATHHSRMCTAQ
ncbi:MAG: hypothetical protein ACK4UO_01020 [Pseudolabrys sp.]